MDRCNPCGALLVHALRKIWSIAVSAARGVRFVEPRRPAVDNYDRRSRCDRVRVSTAAVETPRNKPVDEMLQALVRLGSGRLAQVFARAQFAIHRACGQAW
jgi:hypothetical protein